MKFFADSACGDVHSGAMNATRRSFSATLFPLLALAATGGTAAAKSAGPAEACASGDATKRCAAAKAHFVADGGEDAAACPFCAARRGGKDSGADLFHERGAV